MLIAQISDPHVAEPGDPVRAFVDTNANLAAAIAHLNAMAPRPDIVVATGDLTDHGRVEQYELLAELLGALEIPLFVIPGNHDEVEPLVAVLGDLHRYLPRRGPLHYVVEDHPVRIVAVDSTRPRHHDGLLDEARLEWIDDALARAPDAPTLLMLHHPPFDTGIWWMDASGLKGRDKLEAIVARNPQVRRVIAGHVHRPIHTTWGNTLLSVSPSTAHQVAFDLVPEAEPVLTAESPMLTLLDWRDDVCVSHVVPFDGDVPRLHLADEFGDWQLAVEYMRARPALPK